MTKDISSFINTERGTSERALEWIIFGDPKVGKTTLACSFPDPILIDIEDGAAFQTVPQFSVKNAMREYKMNAFDVLMELSKKIGEGERFKTVVFDTLDELWNIIAHPHKQNGVLPIKSYQLLYDQYRQILKAFKVNNRDVVSTAHVKHEKNEDGIIISTDIDLPGKLQGQITGHVDEILYMTVSRRKIDQNGDNGDKNYKQVRVVVCTPTQHRDLGLIQAGDRSGRLPDYIENPSYNDLAIAKMPFEPTALFDGAGDSINNEEPEPPKPVKPETKPTSKGDANAEPPDDFFAEPK